MKLKILIVDDSIVYRKALYEASSKTNFCDEIKSISSGELALEWLENKSADIVLLDLNMPGMSGMEVLKKIKLIHPEIEVIMISASDEKETDNVINALYYGAYDFIFKPDSGDIDSNIIKIRDTLKILFLSIIQVKTRNVNQVSSTNVLSRKNKINNMEHKPEFNNPDLVLIACSTGGPVALETIFKNININLKFPILVVQHMPEGFTLSLSNSLNHKCFLEICEAKDNQIIEKNKVYIAKGGYHMELFARDNHAYIILNKEPTANGLRPSADKLFSSVADTYSGKNILAIILTGMGTDSLEGIIKLKKICNCYCITQSANTSLVYGMPRAVESEGLSDEVLDLNEIPKKIVEFNNKG